MQIRRYLNKSFRYIEAYSQEKDVVEAFALVEEFSKRQKLHRKLGENQHPSFIPYAMVNGTCLNSAKKKMPVSISGVYDIQQCRLQLNILEEQVINKFIIFTKKRKSLTS